jgi:deoxyribonuclease-4
MPQSANPPLLLGAHMSIAGGIHKAVERAISIGSTALQMFVKNNTQWKGRPISIEDAATYKELISKSRITKVVAHSTYLINLCATDKSVLRKSREGFKDELDRCEQLGVVYLNVHPGSHMGAGEEEGIKRVAESLNNVHELTPGYRVKSVLESTAGQGTAVGYRFEHLRAIIDRIDDRNRMAVCLDTCHVFAAGYDITTEEGYHRTFAEFDAIVGLEWLVAFHVNDSKRELGSRVDRHEHIGKGKIGKRGFRLLMNDTRFAQIPKILETPKGPDLKEDVMNMKMLGGMVGKGSE